MALEPRTGQRPVHSGGRRSKKAVMPSARSAEPTTVLVAL